jgi:hypothetical protein
MAMTPSKGRVLASKRALPPETLDLLRASDGSVHVPLPQRGRVAALKDGVAAQALLEQSNKAESTLLQTLKVDEREFLVFQLPLS